MTIRQMLDEILGILTPAVAETARFETEQLLMQVVGCTRSQLYLSTNDTITDNQVEKLRNYAHRRADGVPLGYVLESVYFYNTDIRVTPDVLIPRQETEVLVDVILHRESNSTAIFLDMCTGSGAISAALLHARPSWQALESDISFPALQVARENITGKHLLVCTNRLAAIKADRCLDFIVSNPPYVSLEEMKELDRSVRDFEPAQALYGGNDGLDFYRYLAGSATHYLKQTGRIYCEIGATQASSVTDLFSTTSWCDLEIIPDLTGRSRILYARTR